MMSVKLSSSSWLYNTTLNLGMFTSLSLGTRYNHAMIIGTYLIVMNGKILADFALTNEKALTNFVSANGMVFSRLMRRWALLVFTKGKLFFYFLFPLSEFFLNI